MLDLVIFSERSVEAARDGNIKRPPFGPRIVGISQVISSGIV